MVGERSPETETGWEAELLMTDHCNMTDGESDNEINAELRECDRGSGTAGCLHMHCR